MTRICDHVPPRLHFEPLKLLISDPDPAFLSSADPGPDPASENNMDPDLQSCLSYDTVPLF